MNKIITGIVIVLLLIVGLVAYNSGERSATENGTNTTGVVENNSLVNGAQVTDVNATSTVEANNGSVKTFVVEASNFKFSMPEMRVNEGDTVRITLKNTQGFHDLVIDEFNAATKKIQAGQEDTIEFTVNKAGVFEYYCSVGSHRAMGMAGNLIVE